MWSDKTPGQRRDSSGGTKEKAQGQPRSYQRNFPTEHEGHGGHGGHPSGGACGSQSLTKQEQLFRSLQEVEARELRRHGQGPLSKSQINYMDQSHKTEKDVERIIESQLIMFRVNLKGCPEEMKQTVARDLAKTTIMWAAQREERGIPYGPTDGYLAQLFEILVTGSTQHPEHFYQRQNIEEEQLRESVQALMYGQHAADKLDRDFKENPDKQAHQAPIRSGISIENGISRIYNTRKDLEQYLVAFQQCVDLR